MEPLKASCYPSNFFDPFGNEPTHGPCAECKEIYDYGDLTNVGTIVFERYLCSDCKEKMMDEKIKRLIKAADGLYGLLVEGLTDTQNEAWNEEVGEFLEALEQAKEED